MPELSAVHDYLRWRKKFPTVWCAGCGIGSIMGAIIRALQDLEIDKDDVALVGGIGCASRMPVYMDVNTMHTTHGRALAFATGIKLHRPDMHVLVVSGDGDALAIGGNHFLHACRRNINLTLVLINNGIYGMTGGQTAPTTPRGAVSHTMPYGNMDPPIDPVAVACSAGAGFVARGTVHGIVATTGYLRKAIAHQGFSLVEIISQCPTQFGRMNRLGDARSMLTWQKEHSITRSRAETLPPEEVADKIVTGIFCERSGTEFCQAYQSYAAAAQAAAESGNETS